MSFATTAAALGAVGLLVAATTLRRNRNNINNNGTTEFSSINSAPKKESCLLIFSNNSNQAKDIFSNLDLKVDILFADSALSLKSSLQTIENFYSSYALISLQNTNVQRYNILINELQLHPKTKSFILSDSSNNILKIKTKKSLNVDTVYYHSNSKIDISKMNKKYSGVNFINLEINQDEFISYIKNVLQKTDLVPKVLKENILVEDQDQQQELTKNFQTYKPDLTSAVEFIPLDNFYVQPEEDALEENILSKVNVFWKRGQCLVQLPDGSFRFVYKLIESENSENFEYELFVMDYLPDSKDRVLKNNYYANNESIKVYDAEGKFVENFSTIDDTWTDVEKIFVLQNDENEELNDLQLILPRNTKENTDYLKTLRNGYTTASITNVPTTFDIYFSGYTNSYALKINNKFHEILYKINKSLLTTAQFTSFVTTTNKTLYFCYASSLPINNIYIQNTFSLIDIKIRRNARVDDRLFLSRLNASKKNFSSQGTIPQDISSIVYKSTYTNSYAILVDEFAFLEIYNPATGKVYELQDTSVTLRNLTFDGRVFNTGDCGLSKADFSTSFVEAKPIPGPSRLMSSSTKSIVNGQNDIELEESKRIHLGLVNHYDKLKNYYENVLQVPFFKSPKQSLSFNKYINSINGNRTSMADLYRNYGKENLIIFYDFIMDIFLISIERRLDCLNILMIEKTVDSKPYLRPINHKEMFNICNRDPDSNNPNIWEVLQVKDVFNSIEIANENSNYSIKYYTSSVFQNPSPYLIDALVHNIKDNKGVDIKAIDWMRKKIADNLISIFDGRDCDVNTYEKLSNVSHPYSFLKYKGSCYKNRNMYCKTVNHTINYKTESSLQTNKKDEKFFRANVSTPNMTMEPLYYEITNPEGRLCLRVRNARIDPTKDFADLKFSNIDFPISKLSYLSEYDWKKIPSDMDTSNREKFTTELYNFYEKSENKDLTQELVKFNNKYTRYDGSGFNFSDFSNNKKFDS